MMVLDQCTDYPIEKDKARAAMEKTIKWAERSQKYYNETFDRERQACFAIIQGSVYNDLRRECAERLVDLDLPGYAIGGLSMGVGSPLEILFAIKHGVDMFDCVMPTRIARNGTLYTSVGRVNIKAAQYEKDFTPLDPNCSCYVCRTFTRAYLRHIFRAGEIASLIYNTYHNLHFMKQFMDEIRESINAGTFDETYKKWSLIFNGA
jgi:queuine tRNA-ribosyltransferase